MDTTRFLVIAVERRIEGGKYDGAKVGKHASFLRALMRIVAIESVGWNSELNERFLDAASDCRFVGARLSRKPERAAAEAVVFVKRRCALFARDADACCLKMQHF